jgi:Skp family chaperone for outer membrane proteins
MKTILTLVAATLALTAGSAFAQSQPKPAVAPVAKVAPAPNAAAAAAQMPTIDAKVFPQVKAGILQQIDTRLDLLQRDRKCVAGAADGKALNDCKKASADAQRAAMEKLVHPQGPQAQPAPRR